MSEQDIAFTPSTPYTLGVEIEFQIVDKTSYGLVPLGPALFSHAPALLKPRIALEFIKPILEIRTGICADLRAVENDLLQTCSLAEELADDYDCLLYAASLHPFANAYEQVLSDDKRYVRIMRELQIVGRRFISQGLHVHVGLPDGDTAIKVGNVIQGFLPVFLALSTSSPFFQGMDTGLMSYRTKLFEVLPLAGIYEHMRDWRHFNREIEDLRGYGIIESFRDLWWDARPNPQFGTIEIRICDLPTRFNDILALVSLIQGCVAWLADLEHDPGPLRYYLLRANKWQAARYGMAGRFTDPTGLLGGRSGEMKAAAALLQENAAPYVRELQASSYLEGIEAIIAGGTGAAKQRSIHTETGDFKDVISRMQQGFWR